jgi:hypothetical protein
MADAVSDLPDPDSPTMQRISPACQVEADAVDRVRAVAARGEGHPQVADAQQGRGRHRPSRDRRGLSASLSPSPTRLRASTVSRMARPGKKLHHQASRTTEREAPIM